MLHNRRAGTEGVLWQNIKTFVDDAHAANNYGQIDSRPARGFRFLADAALREGDEYS